MPLSVTLILSLILGLGLTVLLKLIFNKITGKNGIEFAHLREFFSMFITCFIIVFIIFTVIRLGI